MTGISIHNCAVGPRFRGPVTVDMLQDASTEPGEYVEFDVRATRDAHLVLSHDDRLHVAGPPIRIGGCTLAELRRQLPTIVTLHDALRVLAGVKRAHVDLKLTAQETAVSRRAAAMAVATLGAEQVLFTSECDILVRALVDWRFRNAPALRVGLSIGGRRPRRRWWQHPVDQVMQFFPARRFASSGADVLCTHWLPARVRVSGWTRRRSVPLLVWTVDGRRGLRYWMRPRRAWLLATNRPRLADSMRRTVEAVTTGDLPHTQNTRRRS